MLSLLCACCSASPNGAARSATMTDEAYELLQASKLGEYGAPNASRATQYMEARIRRFDAQNSREILSYLRQPFVKNLVQSPVLCVGARLGGEVRAFNALDSVRLSIGVDLNPGAKNPHVVYGNAHVLQFKNASFGSVFSNVLDHVLHIDKFASEAHRVLVANGTLLVHLGLNTMAQDNWAVHDVATEHTAIVRSIEENGFVQLDKRRWKNKQRMPWLQLIFRRRGLMT